MDARLCVAVVAVFVAASSFSFCAEEISEDVVKINELLASTAKLMDEGKLDKAGILLADAVKRYWELGDDDKALVDKDIITRPFLLADLLMVTPDGPNRTSRTLAWYETYAGLKAYARQHPDLDTEGPDFRGKQKEYAYILGMALAESGYDADKVAKKYPSLAESWAPLVSGDIDGDGRKDIVSVDAGIANQTTYNVIFVKPGGAVLVKSFVDDRERAGFKVADDDGDGVDEILLYDAPRKRSLGVTTSANGPRLLYEWRIHLVVVKYQDGKLVKTREYDRISTTEPE